MKENLVFFVVPAVVIFVIGSLLPNGAVAAVVFIVLMAMLVYLAAIDYIENGGIPRDKPKTHSARMDKLIFWLQNPMILRNRGTNFRSENHPDEKPVSISNEKPVENSNAPVYFFDDPSPVAFKTKKYSEELEPNGNTWENEGGAYHREKE